MRVMRHAAYEKTMERSKKSHATIQARGRELTYFFILNVRYSDCHLKDTGEMQHQKADQVYHHNISPIEQNIK